MVKTKLPGSQRQERKHLKPDKLAAYFKCQRKAMQRWRVSRGGNVPARRKKEFLPQVQERMRRSGDGEGKSEAQEKIRGHGRLFEGLEGH